MEIKELIAKAYENSSRKGFWEDWRDIKGGKKRRTVEIKTGHAEDNLVNNAISSRLMQIVGEAAEAQEALRKADYENFKEELADIAIRLGSLCGGLDIDLEAEIIKKMAINRDRPYLHGKEF
jgi:NTP pyrophosphatase (non-canonical NTP hydrolase)